MKSPFECNYDSLCICPSAQTVIGSINHAILQALATNTRVLFESKEDGNMKDINHVYIPSYIPIIDSNGNPVTHIPRLLRVTNRFVVSIKSEEVMALLETESIKTQVRAFYMSVYDFDDVKISDKKEDGSIKVGFLMKKSTYSEEKEEQTMSNYVKYAYKLNPVPTGASAKAVVPAYYTTAEAAETARECLWANGEISVKSDITRLTIDTDPPKYKGVILKAELLPPKHVTDDWDDLGAWHIDDSSRIEPISYEDYARLRYSDAKNEFQEQELIDADNPADLKEWLPYISPEDNCENRFFYVYFSDKMFRLARHSKGNVALMVSDAYKKFLKEFRDHIIGIPLPSVSFHNVSEMISKAAVDIRDKYPDILMVRLKYPDGNKSRRDIACWDLLNVWQRSELVWSLDPKTLEDTVRYNHRTYRMSITLGNGVFTDVQLSILFNMEEALPLVVFGRDEVFLFVRYRKLKYDDNEKTHQFFVVTTIKEALQNGTFKLRKIG